MTGVVWEQVSPWGLVAGLVILIALGGLIPRWMHNQRINDKEELIKRLTAALDHRDQQFDQLTGQFTLVIKLLEDIKRASDERVSRQPESRHPA